MFIIIVYNLPKLDSVIIYFDTYPLLGKNYSDYINFRDVRLKVKEGEHLRPEGMESLKTTINNKMKNKQVNYDRDNNKYHGLNFPYISKRNFSTNLVFRKKQDLSKSIKLPQQCTKLEV